jgi:hypothetical protein
MSPDSPQNEPLRPPHPLALELIERLRERPRALVLEIGRGSGRNRRALEAAGFAVSDIEDASSNLCAAAISTHALLHGTPDSIAAMLSRISRRLEASATLYATFGSQRDSRYGQGVQLGRQTFAPENGDETGVAHTYFDEGQLRRLLGDEWVIESLEEHDVDEVAGAWAHQQQPLKNSVHWFARLRKR